jgi:hypothetical protein
MIIFSKKYFFSTILNFSFILLFLCACHKRGPGYNPYIHGRTNYHQQRANKRAIDQGTKNYKKQLRKNRRHIFGSPTAPSN